MVEVVKARLVTVGHEVCLDATNTRDPQGYIDSGFLLDQTYLVLVVSGKMFEHDTRAVRC